MTAEPIPVLRPRLSQRVGWWLALEPLGETAAAWSLIRVGDRPIDGPIAAGLIEDMSAARTLAARIPPHRTRDEIWNGPLADLTQERTTAVELGRALLPRELVTELLATGRAGNATPHTVTIACRGWLAQVPWDLLALDDAGDVRLLERARVLGGLSPALSAGRRIAPAPRPDASALRIIDPGPRRDQDVPPIYPGGYPGELLSDGFLGDDDDPRPDGMEYRADDFGQTLSAPGGWSRLLYVGHAREGSSDAPAGAALVFSAGSGADRLTAYDWLRTPERWPMPSRVALIACASDDSVHLEQSGLPVAAVNAGAELLTATRWTLPADTSPSIQAAFTGLAIAVDVAHRAEDAIGWLRHWQRERLISWRATGAPEDSPLLWAALVTYLTGSP